MKKLKGLPDHIEEQVARQVSRTDPRLNTLGYKAQASKGKVRLVPQTHGAQMGRRGIGGFAVKADRVEVPQATIQQMHESLPVEVRRSARERYAELVKMLYADASQQFYRDGKVVWPKSIENEIAIIGLGQGNPNLTEQVEALAGRYLVKGAREQQEQDHKRSTIGWNGHLSA